MCKQPYERKLCKKKKKEIKEKKEIILFPLLQNRKWGFTIILFSYFWICADKHFFYFIEM